MYEQSSIFINTKLVQANSLFKHIVVLGQCKKSFSVFREAAAEFKNGIEMSRKDITTRYKYTFFRDMKVILRALKRQRKRIAIMISWTSR